jgi:putative FmdB family regulatory protein
VPIYEFYCSDCHRLLSFLSRSVQPEKRPACPRCGRAALTRQVSSFAISRGRKEESAPPAAGSGLDEARFERALESMAGEMEGLDESDPRQSAQMMRRLMEAAGAPASAPLEEALKRLESGEDPEKIEAEMGDAMQDPFAGAEGEPRARRISRLARRLRPPTVDPELYEM